MWNLLYYADVVHGAHSVLSILLTHAKVVSVLKRFLHFFHVAHRVELVCEIAREKRLRHRLLSKFHLDEQVVCMFGHSRILISFGVHINGLEVLNGLLVRLIHFLLPLILLAFLLIDHA